MNTTTLKSTFAHTQAWIFAAFITIVSHFILFAIFVPIKFDSTETNTVQQHSQIVMLPLNSKDSNSKIKDIIACINNENPGSIADPSNRFGYSSIIKQSSSLPILQHSLDHKSKLFQQPVFYDSVSVPIIPTRYNTIIDCFDKLIRNQFAFPPINSYTPTNHGKIVYPLVTSLYQGYSLPVIFSNLQEVKHIIKKYNPISSSNLRFYYPENKSLMPSGTIVESCGVNELDKLGLSTITVQNFPDNIKDKLAGKNIDLIIDWQEPYVRLKK